MRLRSASLWAGILSGGISQFQDTMALREGRLSKKQYAAHTTRNITGAVGIMAGIEFGAVLGSTIMPGIGTIAGSVLGGFIGDRVGSSVGLTAGNLLFNNDRSNMNLFGNMQAEHSLITQSMQTESHKQEERVLQ